MNKVEFSYTIALKSLRVLWWKTLKLLWKFATSEPRVSFFAVIVGGIWHGFFK